MDFIKFSNEWDSSNIFKSSPHFSYVQKFSKFLLSIYEEKMFRRHRINSRVFLDSFFFLNIGRTWDPGLPITHSHPFTNELGLTGTVFFDISTQIFSI